MAIAAALTNHSMHLLRYTLTSDGGAAVNIDAAGAVTPDLLTDTLPGPLRDVMTTAVASQAAGRTLAFGLPNLKITFTRRDVDADWQIDATTDGAGHLRLTLTCAAADVLGSMLNIEFLHTAYR